MKVKDVRHEPHIDESSALSLKDIISCAWTGRHQEESFSTVRWYVDDRRDNAVQKSTSYLVQVPSTLAPSKSEVGSNQMITMIASIKGSPFP